MFDTEGPDLGEGTRGVTPQQAAAVPRLALRATWRLMESAALGQASVKLAALGPDRVGAGGPHRAASRTGVNTQTHSRHSVARMGLGSWSGSDSFK